MSEQPPKAKNKKIELDSSEWRGEPNKKKEVTQIEFQPAGRMLEDTKRVEMPPLEPLTDQAVVVREDTLPRAPEILDAEIVEEPLLTARELIVRKLKQEKLANMVHESEPASRPIPESKTKISSESQKDAGVSVDEDAPVMVTADGASFSARSKENLSRDLGGEIETEPDVSEILNGRQPEAAKSETGGTTASAETIAGAEAPKHTIDEVLTPEEKKQLAELDREEKRAREEKTAKKDAEKALVRTNKKKRGHTIEKGRKNAAERRESEAESKEERTPKEAYEYLKKTIHEAKGTLFPDESEKSSVAQEGSTSERSVRLKEYLAETGAILQEKAEKYGPTIVGAIGSVAERYNKLNWKTKLMVTGGLMFGVSLSAATLPLLSGTLTAALYGQRALGAIGMGMNRRKKLDAKIAKNPEHWLAGKSELAKNAYVVLLSAGYMAATSFAVHEGVEAFKTVAHGDLLSNGLQKTQTFVRGGFEKLDSANREINQWLFNHLPGHSPVSESVVGSPAPVTEAPPMSSETGSVSALDAEANAELSYKSGELPPDFEGRFVYDQNGSEYARGLAEQSTINGLGPDDLADLNNKIAGMTPRERNFFDTYAADFSEKLKDQQMNSAAINESIAKARAAVGNMQDLAKDQANILSSIPSDSHIPNSGSGPQMEPPIMLDPSRLPGAESPNDPVILPDTAETTELPTARVSAAEQTPFGHDPIDGHPMSQIEAQKLAELRTAMHDPRETGAWPPGHPEEKSFVERLFGGGDKSNPTSEPDQPAAETPETPPTPTPDADKISETVPFDPVDKNRMLYSLAENSVSKNLTPDELNALNARIGDLSPQDRALFDNYATGLSNQINGNAGASSDSVINDTNPERTDIPPIPTESSGSEPIAGDAGLEFIRNAVGLDVPTFEPHIYADSSDRLFVYGGTNQDRAKAVLEYLNANPNKTVYSADDNGEVRVPWFLRDGQITPGAPVRTSGFFGFGASAAQAPEPDEFVKIIK